MRMTPMRAKTPPTAPPAMAPTFLGLLVEVGLGLGVAVGVAVVGIGLDAVRDAAL